MATWIYVKTQRNGYVSLCDPMFHFHLVRRFSLWSMKKDPDLEAALHRNRRWVVNNQIKNIIMRCPDQVASVKYLQKKFKTLDLQGKALNWLKKIPLLL
uniref:Putative ovule protein n=1 Tax=Solanum chacoense TaxID=4108 RepID=A0A0V0HGY9_SOLCH